MSGRIWITAVAAGLLASPCCLTALGQEAPDDPVVAELLSAIAGAPANEIAQESRELATLAEARRGRIAPQLIEALSHEDRRVRYAAASALKSIEPRTAAIHSAIESALLRETDGIVAMTLVDSLQDAGPSALPTLLRFAEGGGHAGTVAALSLGRYGSDARAALPALVRLVKAHPDSMLLEVISQIGRLDPQADEVVRPLLGRPDVAGRALMAYSVVAPPDRSIPALIERLITDSAFGSPDLPSELHALTVAAAHIGEPAVDPLLAVLKADEPSFRRRAAAALASIGAPAARAVPELRAAIASSKTPDDCDIVRYLGPMGAPVTALLLDAMESPQSEMRAAAADALTEAPNVAPESVHRMASLLERTRVPEEQLGLLDALRRAGPAARPALDVVVECLGSEELLFRVGSSAEETLLAMGASAADAIPSLVRSVREAGPRARAAGNALARIPGGKNALLPLIEDPRPAVRDEAVSSLGLYGDPPARALQPLVDLLKRSPDANRVPDVVVRCGPDAVPTLLKLLEKSPPAVRVAVVKALTFAGTTAVTAALVRASADASADVRFAAVSALQFRRDDDQAMVAALLVAAEDKDQRVSDAAATALSRLVCPSTPPLAAAIAKDRPPRVRRAALGALGRSFSRSAAEALAAVALTEPDDETRRAALSALFAHGRRGSAALTKAMTAPVDEAGVRRIVAEVFDVPSTTADASFVASLIRSLGPEAVQAAGRELASEDRQRQRRAADVLASIGTDAAPALPELVAALDVPSSREDAARILGSLGALSKPYVPKIASLLNTEDGEAARSAVSALARIGPDAAAATKDLIAALGSRVTLLPEAAAGALVRIGAAAKPELELALTTADEPQKVRIREILGLIR